MSGLTTFVKASEEALKKWDESHSFANGTSPFVDGLVFQVTKRGGTHKSEDGVVDTTKLYPVFETTVGDLYISTQVRNYTVIEKGVGDSTKFGIARADGDLTKLIDKTVAENRDKGNGEIFDLVLAKIKGKNLKVRRVPITRNGKYGPYAAALVCVDFA